MKIEVNGVICSNDDKPIYDMFGMESTSPSVISEAIKKADGKDLEIYINSGGGDLFSGSQIFTELKDYKGNVEVKITGVAASAASIIAMGADKVVMSPTSSLMIHNVSLVAGGDYNDMQKASDTLKTLNKTVANAYRDRTGLEQDELLELMNKETWLDAYEAKEKGFIDEIMFEPAKAVAGLDGMIPQKVIEGVRNAMFNKITNEEDGEQTLEQTSEETNKPFTDEQEKAIKDIVKEEIEKQLNKEDSQEKKEESNIINNKFKRWL